MSQTIEKFTVSGYKGIAGTVTLQPGDQKLQVIAGPNGAGKSSFIDAIAEIFDPKGTRLTAKPINDNAEIAFAEVATDEAVARRTWKKNDAGSLTVKALNGKKLYGSPRDFIVQATGGALFDPYEFVGLDEKKQRAQLLERVELPFDLDELALKHKTAYDARTEVGRMVAQLSAQLAAFAAVDPMLPAVETSASDLVAQLDEVRAENAAVNQAIALAQSTVIAEREAHEAAKAAYAAFEVARDKHTAAIAAMNVANASDAIGLRRDDDEAALVAKLANVDELNAKIRAQNERGTVSSRLVKAQLDQAMHTAKLEEIEKTKADGLAAAQFPVEGLSVDDEGITFNGIPFAQVNKAKKTIIAFDLATLVTPDIPLVVIKDGDALDNESVAGIQALADARGFYVLMERDRDNSREIGFTIPETTAEPVEVEVPKALATTVAPWKPTVPGTQEVAA